MESSFLGDKFMDRCGGTKVRSLRRRLWPARQDYGSGATRPTLTSQSLQPMRQDDDREDPRAQRDQMDVGAFLREAFEEDEARAKKEQEDAEKKEKARLRKENDRLKEKNARLKEDSARLQEENARLRKESTAAGKGKRKASDTGLGGVPRRERRRGLTEQGEHILGVKTKGKAREITVVISRCVKARAQQRQDGPRSAESLSQEGGWTASIRSPGQGSGQRAGGQDPSPTRRFGSTGHGFGNCKTGH
ncbi:hypothetical protein CF319_g2565 [Tilletia indica]|nr:hypothetical protein CF319_g2565 [Tilletia indica]